MESVTDIISKSANSSKFFIKYLDIMRESFFRLSFQEQLQMLDLLEMYECWEVFLELISKIIAVNVSDIKYLEFYVRLAKVQSLYLDDIFSATETCIKAIEKFNLNYSDYRSLMLLKIIDKDDYTKEVSLLRAIENVFKNIHDKISVLERICFIFEKKLYDEEDLQHYYEKLISVDPYNKRALRYFKLIYINNNDWHAVANILTRMLQFEKNMNFVFTIAQELAYVYLYELDQPRECIKILDTYCEDSPLDIITLYYDAYYKLSDWEGCLSILRKALIKFDCNATMRAKIHFKMGEIKALQQNYEEALAEYKKVLSLDSNIFNVYENIINIYVYLKKWDDIISMLDEIKFKVDSVNLKAEIEHLKVRLLSGINNNVNN